MDPRSALVIGVFAAFMSTHGYAATTLPTDAAQDRAPEQEALNPKGFYIDQTGAVRRLHEPDRLGCKGFEIQAHRGYVTQPENSLSAVVTALSAKFNAAEVDVRRLRDGTWVLSHDGNTKRTMLNTTGKTSLRSMNLADWSQATMRNRDGTKSQETPVSLEQTLTDSLTVMSHGQTMNIELKAKHGTCKSIGELNALTTGILGDNRANYSSMNGTGPLVCVRKYNPSTYVALIQGPSRKALEKWAAATHGEELSKLSGNKRLFAGAKMATEAFGGYQYPSWSSAAKLSELRRTLGNNVGLHVEITDLKADPSLVSRVRAAGVKLMSYTLTDNDSHIRDLLALKSMGALPDGAILDSTPIKACKMLGLE